MSWLSIGEGHLRRYQSERSIREVARSVKLSDVIGGLLLFVILGIAGCEPEYAPASFVSLEERHQSGAEQ